MSSQKNNDDMSAVKQVALPEALSEDAAQKIFAVLNPAQNNGGYQTLFVGGCVRNALLGAPVVDVDLATKFRPDSVMSILEARGIRVIPTGIDHGTVTAVLEERSFEITTLRKDVETDGRRAVVAFADNWADDAQRRDFTMNTLLADIQGNIYDPLGQGMDDLTARYFRFVGDAQARVREDLLRILRYFRFQAIYGGDDWDADALNACCEFAPRVFDLSKERITQEFVKLIFAPAAPKTLEIMFAHGVLKSFDFGGDARKKMDALAGVWEHFDLDAVFSTRLWIFCAENLQNVERVLDALILPKAVRQEITALEQARNAIDWGAQRSVRKALYMHGRDAVLQALVLSLADDVSEKSDAQEMSLYIEGYDIPKFPVGGEDIKRAGIAPGPEIGIVLKRLEELWIEGDFTISKDSLLSSLSAEK